MATLYAHILVDPKRKSRWVRRFEQTPQLKAEPPTWYEESWSVSRSMGSAKAEAYRMTRTGAGWGMPASYDARIVSEADRAAIEAIDQAILDLQKQKSALVKDHFLTWPLVTPGDCKAQHTGKSKVEADREARTAKVPGLTSLASEQRMVKGLRTLLA